MKTFSTNLLAYAFMMSALLYGAEAETDTVYYSDDLKGLVIEQDGQSFNIAGQSVEKKEKDILGVQVVGLVVVGTLFILLIVSGFMYWMITTHKQHRELNDQRNRLAPWDEETYL